MKIENVPIENNTKNFIPCDETFLAMIIGSIKQIDNAVIWKYIIILGTFKIAKMFMNEMELNLNDACKSRVERFTEMKDWSRGILNKKMRASGISGIAIPIILLKKFFFPGYMIINNAMIICIGLITIVIPINTDAMN